MVEFTIQDSLRFVEVIMITITAIIIIVRMTAGSVIDDAISGEEIIAPMALAVVFFAIAGLLVASNIFTQVISFPTVVENNLFIILVVLAVISMVVMAINWGIGLILLITVVTVSISIYIIGIALSILFFLAMACFMFGLIQMMMDISDEVGE